MNRVIQLAIEDAFSKKIKTKIENGEIADSPYKILSERYKLGKHLPNLLGIVPEILCGFLAKKSARDILSFSYPPHTSSLKDSTNILLCHALSPYSESIGLYCDIGRAFRISSGLSLKTEVMLAGVDWTEYNWVVVDLALKQNLHESEKWRKHLYSQLGISYKVCGMNNALSDNKGDDGKIRHIAGNYVKISKMIWGNAATTKKYSAEERDVLLNKKSDFFEYANIDILKQSLGPAKETIECVLKNFHRLDFDTFIYFMLQFYHQSNYKYYIKVSMHRERDFDESFRKIIESSNLFTSDGQDKKDDHLNLVGLYLDDYEYGVSASNEVLTAHPYYFPSGTIYNLYGDDLKAAINNCIMISDTTIESKSKIINILSKTDKFSRARLISDLLSFAHLLTLKSTNADKAISNWMRKHNNSFLQSWNKYAKNASLDDFEKNCKNWSELVFSRWAESDKLPVPYHFLPFFWEDMPDSHVKYENLADLIIIILKEAEKHVGLPEVIKHAAD